MLARLVRDNCVALALLLAACAPAMEPNIAANAAAVSLERHREAARLTRGLSGLTRDEHGVLWAVPERQRQLFALELADVGTVAARGVRLVGVPDGVDTESIAALGGGRFALGTETQATRQSDEVLFATLGGDELTVHERLRLAYDSFGLEAEPNRGLEGLCFAAPWLVAAAETVGVAGGRRYAPLAWRELDDGAWRTARLYLTTATGKVSALACRAADDGRLELLAIERHYGTSRVLRARLSPEATADLEPEVALDLTRVLGARPPNVEGIAFVHDARVALVIDNDTGGVGDASELVFLRLSP